MLYGEGGIRLITKKKRLIVLAAVVAGGIIVGGLYWARQVNKPEIVERSISTTSSSESGISNQMEISQTVVSSQEDEPIISQSELNQQLVTAVTQQNYQITKESLEAGADVESRNEKQATVLLIATQVNNLALAQLLLANGASVNSQDAIEDSPFLFAGAEGRLEILKELAKYQPDQQVVNRYGGNALIPAAEKGHLENVRFLLAETEVDVNHVNQLGWTALLEAIALTNGDETQQAIVKELLANGADPTIKDSQGVSPLAHARRLGYGNIANMLIAAGGVE